MRDSSLGGVSPRADQLDGLPFLECVIKETMRLFPAGTWTGRYVVCPSCGNLVGVNDDRCYPDMLRVLEREGGSWLSWLRLRFLARRLFYSWLPWRLRLRLRRALSL